MWATEKQSIGIFKIKIKQTFGFYIKDKHYGGNRHHCRGCDVAMFYIRNPISDSFINKCLKEHVFLFPILGLNSPEGLLCLLLI